MDISSLNSGIDKKSMRSGSLAKQDGVSLKSSKSLKTIPQEIEPNSFINDKRNSKFSERISMNNYSAHSTEMSQQEKISTLGERQGTASMRSYGVDGQKGIYTESSTSDSSRYITPKCIPPWATTMRRKYGLSTTSPIQQYPTQKATKQMQEKLEKLMKKHNQLMLVKKMESKRELVLEPNKYSSHMETLKMRSKNTKYYVSPLSKGDKNKSIKDANKRVGMDSNDLLVIDNSDYDSPAITHKKPRPHVKKEIFNYLTTLKNRVNEKQNEIYSEDYKIEKEERKCPKITLSNIREYVQNKSMNPDEKKLHEIIRIEKVPSGNIEDRRKTGIKYIINVPQCKSPEMTNIDVIKIKEKHKLQLHSTGNIDKHVIKSQHFQTTKEYKVDEESFIDIPNNIRKIIKSPTETKTLEVTTKRTPRISPFIDKDNKEIEKLLLIQFEQKQKPGKNETLNTTKTQLLGIKEAHNEDHAKEMYLYNTDTDGTTVTGNVTKVEDVSPTLREKVNLLFEELRDLTFQTPIKPVSASEEDKGIPTKESIGLLSMPTKGEATVQAVPEVKSAEIQVRQSMFLDYGSDHFLRATHVSNESIKTDSIIDKISKTDIGGQMLVNDAEPSRVEESEKLSDTKRFDSDILPIHQSEHSNKQKNLEHIGEIIKTQERIEEKQFIEEVLDEDIELDKYLETEDIQSKFTGRISLDKESSGSVMVGEKYKSETFKLIPLNNAMQSHGEVKHSKTELPSSIHSKDDVTALKDDTKASTNGTDLKTEVTSSKTELPLKNDVLTPKTDDLDSKSEIASSKVDVASLEIPIPPKDELFSLKPDILYSDLDLASSKTELPSPMTEDPFPKMHEESSKQEATTSKTDEVSSNILKIMEEDLENTTETDKVLSKIPKVMEDHDNTSKTVVLKIHKIKEEVLDNISLEDEIGNVNESDDTIEDSNKPNKQSEMENMKYEHKDSYSNENASDKRFTNIMHEDIRSYELLPDQGYNLKSKSSTKFLHQRESLRKKMDWTDNTVYLEKKTCPILIRALAETAMQQPADPISFLAHLIYKDYHNGEIKEQKEVWQEHLELARAMEDLKKDKINGKDFKKFGLKKYPIAKDPEILTNEEENGDFKTGFEEENEIVQEA